MIQVVIAEGTPLFRSGLAALLGEQPDLSVADATDSGGGLAALGRRLRPDVALVGGHLTDMAGIDAVRALLRAVPHCGVVAMVERRPGELRRAVDGGALGVVPRDVSPGELLDAVRRAARGEHVIDATLTVSELAAARNPLTPRELDVLEAVADGATVGEIARQLCLSAGTVRNHLARVLSKLGARTRVEAVSMAREHGWLPQGGQRGPHAHPLRR